jgi:hypothetical protein
MNIPMRLVIKMAIRYLGGRIWKFEMSIYVNDMEKSASSELDC